MSTTRTTQTFESSAGPHVTVRVAGAGDADALRRLAGIDSAHPLTGAILLAEVEGEIVSALALEDGRAIADPFRHTAAAVELLALRAAQIRRGRLVAATPRPVGVRSRLRLAA